MPTTTTRRQLLQSAFAAAGALSLTACNSSPQPATQGSPYWEVMGAQLYTVRDLLPSQPLETLRAIEKMGYREVEVVGASLEQIWPSLQQTALKPVSVHLDTKLFLPEQEAALSRALDDAKNRGFDYVLCPYVDRKDRGGPDVYKRMAANLNRVGERSRNAGMTFCYHNHAFEFEPMEGTTPLELLMTGTDPANLGLELDVFWVSVAGLNPADVLSKYSQRVPLVHLKDKAPGTQQMYNEAVPPTAFLPVGSGELDFRAILDAGNKAGVKHYFVEQDQSGGKPLEGLQASMTYLKSLGAS
jgi:sugar phosphate isomerase/epimerase